jgi:hypothetical protein
MKSGIERYMLPTGIDLDSAPSALAEKLAAGIKMRLSEHSSHSAFGVTNIDRQPNPLLGGVIPSVTP